MRVFDSLSSTGYGYGVRVNEYLESDVLIFVTVVRAKKTKVRERIVERVHGCECEYNDACVALFN